MRILIADDDAVSRLRLERTLEQGGHEVIAVADGSAAIAALQAADAPLMAILDWMMPGADGVDVVRTLRARTAPYVYVILLTSRDGRTEMVEALDAGADDFLTKPFEVNELRARLRSGERVLELQDRLLRAEEAMRVEAMHDDLTGLWNRRMILEQLGRERSRARHEGTSLAVILIDIDEFKQINDSYGHTAGDLVLTQTAARMRAVVRSYDFIGRYGGDEFLILLPNCEQPAAREIATRVRLSVGKAPVQVGAVEASITISLGIAWSSTAAEEPAALIQAADEALYRAKAAGRNRVEA